MSKTAFITGITGQDGAYLTHLLLSKGYEVHGIKRRSSASNLSRLNDMIRGLPNSADRFHLHFGDLTDGSGLAHLIAEIQPDELYNLGAQSHVQVSFETAKYTADVNALGTVRLLEILRAHGLGDKTKFYQASTSEIFGHASTAPQNETTPFQPRSPYAIAKLHAYWTTRLYREAYGVHATNGILFNHESPIRGETFVSRKITQAVAAIEAGKRSEMCLGNLDSQRDWGHARDYVEGMWRMLQQETSDDYVLATGRCHSVRTFVETAFNHVGRSLVWEGQGLSEVGRDANSGHILVRCDNRHTRATEIPALVGDASKARERLGWVPTTSFEDLVQEMLTRDLQLAGITNLASSDNQTAKLALAF